MSKFQNGSIFDPTGQIQQGGWNTLAQQGISQYVPPEVLAAQQAARSGAEQAGQQYINKQVNPLIAQAQADQARAGNTGTFGQNQLSEAQKQAEQILQQFRNNSQSPAAIAALKAKPTTGVGGSLARFSMMGGDPRSGGMSQLSRMFGRGPRTVAAPMQSLQGQSFGGLAPSIDDDPLNVGY